MIAVMAQTVSDHIIQRLYAWGIRTIYGYPGDGINGLIGAIERAEGRIRFIQPCHEEAAAFMACGHAKFTGQVGVCMATSGPGAIHLLNGLYDARMDHQPVVAIVGQSARTAIGADYQQEVDLASLFKDVAHHYVHECSHPAAARHQIDRAMRIAFAERTVTCVIVPHDVQELDAIESPPHEHDVTLSGIGCHRGVVIPTVDPEVPPLPPHPRSSRPGTSCRPCCMATPTARAWSGSRPVRCGRESRRSDMAAPS